METECARYERNYGIDLLRIIAMSMIVTLHGCTQTELLKLNGTTVESKIVIFLQVVCIYGVNCFGLISGYVEKQNVPPEKRLRKLFQIWVGVASYTVPLGLLRLIMFPSVVGRDTILDLFPILGQRYWYLLAYFSLQIILIFFSPKMGEKESLYVTPLLVTILFISIVVPFALKIDPLKMSGGYSVQWLTVLYCIGFFMHRRCGKHRINKGAVTGIFIMVTLFTYCFLIRYGDEKLLEYNSPLILVGSICLVLLFESLTLKARWTNCIRIVTPAVFGIYIIHFQVLVSGLLGKMYLKIGQCKGCLLLGLMILATVCVMVGCIIVENARIKVFKKGYSWVRKVSE